MTKISSILWGGAKTKGNTVNDSILFLLNKLFCQSEAA